MQIVVRASAEQQEAFLLKGVPAGVTVCWDHNVSPSADAYFDLLFEDADDVFAGAGDKPVFVNAVVKTGAELPSNYVRINAWSGFLAREIIEVAGAGLSVPGAAGVLDSLAWGYLLVPDKPGLVAARVIAMIINEAYYALGDGISTRDGIDTAMKLGTNYPYGPFEWSNKIGLQKIYELLEKLSVTDSRYQPAPALLTDLGVFLQ